MPSAPPWNNSPPSVEARWATVDGPAKCDKPPSKGWLKAYK